MELRDASILVVDDDRDLLTAARLLLKPHVRQLWVEHNPENLPALLFREQVDLILLDMNFNSAIQTGNEGLYWLKEIKSMRPQTQVVMITAFAGVDLAVQSLKQGASDFVVKPWQNKALLEVLATSLGSRQKGKAEHTTPHTPDRRSSAVIGEAAIMQDALYKLEKIATTDANILILGENGTGKDLFAQTIHERSARKAGPFVKVDVGALTETLFESELFGHRKGAFTDAKEDRKGRFEAAHRGTLFLDEIGNIPLHQQAKLLSVLQNREVLPLGDYRPVAVDIRLLSATNVPISALSDEQRFRRDLIYRINTVEIHIPPLRDRGRDVLLLAAHFLAHYNQKYNKQVLGLEPDAEQKLLDYHFPGNVRELQYVIERAVIMTEHASLRGPDLLFSQIAQADQRLSVHPGGRDADTPRRLEEVERTAIENAMRRHSGNISKAATELGITRAALYRRLEKFNI